MLPKPNNIIEIKTKLDTSFFRWWCTFLYPLTHLTGKETEVISCFLKQRFELSKSISDEALLDKVVMSDDIRKKVQEECGMSKEHFYVVMSNLKKKGIIKNDIITSRLIPNINTDNATGYFQLLLLFKYDIQENNK